MNRPLEENVDRMDADRSSLTGERAAPELTSNDLASWSRIRDVTKFAVAQLVNKLHICIAQAAAKSLIALIKDCKCDQYLEYVRWALKRATGKLDVGGDVDGGEYRVDIGVAVI